MITWEFPPRVVGGIAPHCHGLSKSLVERGHEVHVFTLDFPGTAMTENVNGVRVHRTRTELGHPNFLTWTFLFNHFIEKDVAAVSHDINFDIIHIHDWLTAEVGISVKKFLGKPLVSTVHSTEMGRAKELHNPDSYTIDGMEWWMTYESTRVIVCSESMKWELNNHFHLPLDKISNIPNAIDTSRYQRDVDRGAVRWRYGVAFDEKLVLFVGRLVPQKGVEYLIQAVPTILSHHPEARFIIVGDGWSRGYLEGLAASTGKSNRIRFEGFISESELADLSLSADALVVPSVYEPFGIVALEAMAAGIPVIATNTGGLAEIVEHDKSGVLVYPRSSDSIAWGVDKVLGDDGYAKWLTQNAKRRIAEKYAWEIVAKETERLYEEALQGDKKRV